MRSPRDWAHLATTVKSDPNPDPTTATPFHHRQPRLLRYLGSKRRLTSWIAPRAMSAYNGGSIIDLFAGSGAMTQEFRRFGPVISNDVETFAYCLAAGLTCASEPLSLDNQSTTRFQAAYQSNLAALTHAWSSHLVEEQRLLSAATPDLELIRTFYSNLPSLSPTQLTSTNQLPNQELPISSVERILVWSELPISSVERSYSLLCELISPYLQDCDVTVVPMGPKPHVLASLLLCMRFEEIACLRVVTDRRRPFAVRPQGTFSVTRVEVRPSLQAWSDGQSG
jgi:hypothetical protein